MEEREAAAFVEGIALAVDMGWSFVRVESDSETVIKHLKKYLKKIRQFIFHINRTFRLM